MYVLRVLDKSWLDKTSELQFFNLHDRLSPLFKIFLWFVFLYYSFVQNIKILWLKLEPKSLCPFFDHMHHLFPKTYVETSTCAISRKIIKILYFCTSICILLTLYIFTPSINNVLSLNCRCNLVSLQKRHVAIARLKHPANMGRTLHEVRFFILVLTPSKEVNIL